MAQCGRFPFCRCLVVPVGFRVKRSRPPHPIEGTSPWYRLIGSVSHRGYSQRRKLALFPSPIPTAPIHFYRPPFVLHFKPKYEDRISPSHHSHWKSNFPVYWGCAKQKIPKQRRSLRAHPEKFNLKSQLLRCHFETWMKCERVDGFSKTFFR